MAKIRHLAITTDDPPKLAEFYKTTFGMYEVLRREKEKGAVYLSDGYMNLAILNTQGDGYRGPDGINHLGFHVDDVDSTAQTAYDEGARPPVNTLPRDGRFAEIYIFDPTGQRVDLSSVGWRTEPS